MKHDRIPAPSPGGLPRPGRRVRRKKRDFAAPHRILIDDTAENIDAWVAAGGQGILHRHDHASTVAALNRLLELYRDEQLAGSPAA